MIQSPRAGNAFSLALLSLVLGVASLFLLIIAGIPAMLLGLHSLRAINAIDGPARGRSLAIGGMALGAVGTLLSIVGIIALVVLQLRAKANTTTCQNNLRVVGKAVSMYQVENGYYPQGTIANSRLPDADSRLSWMVAVLPYLTLEPEDMKHPTPEKDLAGKFDLKQGWEAEPNRAAGNTTLRWFLCPSQYRPGLTDYIGLAGVGSDSAELPLRLPDRSLDPRAGFFGYDREITTENIEAGIGNTVMIGETMLDNGPWSAGGRPTVRGLDPADEPYIGYNRQFGGLHRGGGYFLFVDGHVEFLSDEMGPNPLEQLMTLARD